MFLKETLNTHITNDSMSGHWTINEQNFLHSSTTTRTTDKQFFSVSHSCGCWRTYTLMDLILYGLTGTQREPEKQSGLPLPGCQQQVGNQLHSYYFKLLPREFTQITVILAYVPGPDYNLAADWIADFWAVTRTGEQLVFLLGDFDRCDVTTVLPNLEQYMTSPMRLDRMLDLCYGNIPGAYISKACPPIGRSDHNVILLLPWYRQKIKTDKIQTKIIKTWDNDSIEELRGRIESTDWNVFFKNDSDLNLLTDSISSYLTFCTDAVIPSKQVRLHPSNKPWVTKGLKICLNKKKLAFLSGDRQKVNELEKEFRQKSRLAKIDYKNKVEGKFTAVNVREAWQGLNTMMGREQRPAQIIKPPHSTRGCHDPALPTAFGLRVCSSYMERIHHHTNT